MMPEKPCACHGGAAHTDTVLQPRLPGRVSRSTRHPAVETAGLAARPPCRPPAPTSATARPVRAPAR